MAVTLLFCRRTYRVNASVISNTSLRVCCEERPTNSLKETVCHTKSDHFGPLVWWNEIIELHLTVRIPQADRDSAVEKHHTESLPVLKLWKPHTAHTVTLQVVVWSVSVQMLALSSSLFLLTSPPALSPWAAQSSDCLCSCVPTWNKI